MEGLFRDFFAVILYFIAIWSMTRGDVVLADTDPPTVETDNAVFRGQRYEVSPKHVPGFRRNVAVYTRIPYAQPPVGQLRYARPVPLKVEGAFDATRQPIACSQVKTPYMILDMPYSEDCLYLDVTVPEPQPKSAAVMVYIHGGGFHIGTGKKDIDESTRLAALGDVIIVTFNYRLGMLGFLTTGDDEIPANLGLLDQRLALLWVQQNIAAFGGDPHRVTIFGISAGSGAVNLHLVSTMSAGLFSGAIMQSGALAMWTHLPSMDHAVQMTNQFAKEVGCEETTSADLAKCLRGKSVEELANVQANVSLSIAKYMFLPVADGQFLLKNPTILAEEGSFNPANVISGCLSQEGNMAASAALFGQEGPGKAIVDEAAFRQRLSSLFFLADPIVQDMIALVFGSEETFGGDNVNFVDAVSGFVGAVTFVCPTNTMVAQLARAGHSVYKYSMTHSPSHSVWGRNFTGLGASHGEDIPYVFAYIDESDDVDGDYYMRGRFTEEEGVFSLQIMKYWTNFAKTGDPNVAASDDEERFPSNMEYPAWPKSTTLEQAYKELSLTFPNHAGAPLTKECHFLSSLLPKIMANSGELAHLKALLEEKVNADSAETCENPESCP